MPALKKLVGKIWSFNMFLKMHIYVNIHLTAYLPFFSQDDILATGVLMKQSKNVFM